MTAETPVIEAAARVLHEHLNGLILGLDETPPDEFMCCARELWDSGLLIGSNRIRYRAGGLGESPQ